ncbi:MAG: hypothetical protein COB02_09960 [Candidatus Cloacimonadota bacterium]|nr:MAG: hypothetical protein COB02_09960 [Candidatus Cloacimonadota bacterium]
MFESLRLQEKILIAVLIVFIPSYTFYSRIIAPRFGASALKGTQRRIIKLNKDLGKLRTTENNMTNELASLQQVITNTDKRIARMRNEAQEFKKFILGQNYEQELYQYLFGRDARYNLIALGNSPKRIPKNSYTEIIYTYLVKGQFIDVVKLVKKIENVSKSVSISSLTLERPKKKSKDGVQKDKGLIQAKLKIHVIFSSLGTALSFEEFKKNEPKLEVKKIDGNPWDSNFGEAEKSIEGPNSAVKKLILRSVIYAYSDIERSALFGNGLGWKKQGDEFLIEPRKSHTLVRLLHIGGKYTVVKHLNKNEVFKLTLNVSAEDETERNIVELIPYTNE